MACRTSVAGRRFGPHKNFGVAPPMVRGGVCNPLVDRKLDVQGFQNIMEGAQPPPQTTTSQLTLWVISA